MKTKRFLQTLCLVLLAIIVMAIPADAQVRVPFQNGWWTKILVTPDGPSALTGIVNVDDEPVEVDFYVFDVENHLRSHQNFVLDAYRVRTWNFANLALPYTPSPEHPNGEFEGYFKFHANRRVLIGDVFVVDFAHSFADGNQLIPLDECNGANIRQCDTYAIRYLQGGGFDGGTLISGIHNGGSFSVHDIEMQLYNELGQAAGSFMIPDVPTAFDFHMGDYNPVDPFGWGFVYLPEWGSVTGTYSAFDRYSVGLEAWCIPPCDHCDPLGMCYNPGSGCGTQCVPANLRLSSGSSQVCQVGAPFSATLVATGTSVGPITCTNPLPDGLTRTGNTIAGICENDDIPSIICNVTNACGSDEIIIAVQEGPPQYDIEVEKLIQEKGCLQSGQNETYAIFNIIVRNRGTDPIVVDISDPSAPECNRQNQTIINGTPYTATCTVQYPLGHHSNTAFVTIDGTTIEVSSTAEFDIVSCPLACDGVAQPTFNLSLLTENNATATTRSVLSYTGAGVVGNVGFQAPTLPSGGFTGGNVVANANNDSIFQKTNVAQTIIANWNVSRNGEVCYSDSAQLTIQPQAGCDAYPIPTITLTETSVLTATDKIVNIVPNPAGGTFNRPVPVTIPRPLFGQPAGSENFLYTLPYIPDGTNLHCTATKSITVTVPPRDPGCADFPVDVIEGTPVTSQTATQFTVQSLPFTTSPNTAGTMVWTPNPPQTYTRPLYGQPAGSASFTGVYTYSPASGLTCTAPAAKTVSIPPRDPQCSDLPVTVTPGTPVTSQTATTFTVSSIPYTTSPNTSGTGVWTPTLPDTRNRPAFGQPAGSQTYNLVFTYTPATGLTCTATASKTVSIPPQTASCADYPTTVTPGTPVTSQTNTTFTVSSIPYTTSPSRTGTIVWTPTLPDTRNRPPFGQTASQTYNGVFTYTPVTGLTCTATASKTVTIPPQTCDVSNPPSATVTYRDQQASGTWTLYIDAAFHNAGPWWVCEYATTDTTRCNAHNFDNEKNCVQVNLSCGGNSTGTASFPWQGHSAEKWRGMVFQGIKPTFVAGQPLDISHMMAETACITNTHN